MRLQSSDRAVPIRLQLLIEPFRNDFELLLELLALLGKQRFYEIPVILVHMSSGGPTGDKPSVNLPPARSICKFGAALRARQYLLSQRPRKKNFNKAIKEWKKE